MEEFIKRVLNSDPIIRNHQAQSDPPVETTALKKSNPADDMRTHNPNEVRINESGEKEHVSSDIGHFKSDTEKNTSEKEDFTNPDNVIIVEQSSVEVEEERQSYNPFSSFMQSFKDEDPNDEKVPPTYADFEKMLEKVAEDSDFLS